MTNAPIYRLPLDTIDERELINSEPHLINGDIRGALGELTDEEHSDDVLGIVLDWAMQLRERTGHDWGLCIRAAMISYFG